MIPLLLLAVIFSGIVSRVIPLPFPRPLFQIALGAVIGLVADWRVTLYPEIFFLLPLPPLLFLDGWRIPREELFKDGKTVLELALGLVVFTMVGMGFFITWMIPSMPLRRKSLLPSRRPDPARGDRSSPAGACAPAGLPCYR